MQKKIKKITIRQIYDENPILDWIGTFDSDAKSEFAINHRERSGDRNAFEYFNPQPYVCETQEQAEKAYKRIMDFESGNVCCLGIEAEAEIRTSDNGNEWLINHVSSDGLWGIESDSDQSYFNEIAEEQKSHLADVLLALGFTADEINNAPVELKTL